MRTLPLRMEAHSRNALAVARFLDARPEVRFVSYPGLPGHPQHEMATRQFSRGYGGMMAIRLEGGEAEMYAFTDALQMCAIAALMLQRTQPGIARQRYQCDRFPPPQWRVMGSRQTPEQGALPVG